MSDFKHREITRRGDEVTWHYACLFDGFGAMGAGEEAEVQAYC